LAANACASRGLDVAVLAPGLVAPWTNNYGAWVDELEEIGLADFTSHRWPQVEVFSGEAPLILDRAYARVDGAALRSHLLEQSHSQGVRFQRGTAVALEHHAAGSRVQTREGEEVEAAVVIDATGHFPRFVSRPADGPTAFQTAWGVFARVSGSPFATDRMRFMDFRDQHLDDGDRSLPTFLYAMSLGESRFFLEETALVRSPEVPYDVLEQRLRSRLRAGGVRLEQIDEVELCWIPMDPPLPTRGQRVVGFGAAASMVHPATGYLLPRAGRTAPRVAAALAEGLQHGPRRASDLAWEAIWPEDARRCWGLYRFGARFLCDLDAAQTRAFFDAFFSLPDATWRGYLSGDLTPRELAAAMFAVFGLVGTRIRMRMIAAASTDSSSLFRSLTGL
jgi:lycopene cyclase-like protein